jgi:type IV pilus assembly protein PilB
VAEKDDYLLDLLVDLGFTNAEQVAKARTEAQAAGIGVVDQLVASQAIRPGDVTQAMAAQFGAEVVHLANTKIEDDVIAIIPRHVAKKYRVLPLFKTDGKIAVAIADPSDLNTIDSLHHLLNAEIEYRVASEAEIDAALNKYYGGEKKNHRRRPVQGCHPGTDGSRRANRQARRAGGRWR